MGKFVLGYLLGTAVSMLIVVVGYLIGEDR